MGTRTHRSCADVGQKVPAFARSIRKVDQLRTSLVVKILGRQIELFVAHRQFVFSLLLVLKR